MAILQDWQNFYFMAGGAAATLIGLMFIAISLGSHLVNKHDEDRIQTFVNPTLRHFGSALLLAFTILAPKQSHLSLMLCLLVIGVFGFRRTVQVLSQMKVIIQQEAIDPGHWSWHAYFPLASYGLISGVAVGLAFSDSDLIFNGIALATVSLLFIGIRNTWELTLWIARQPR